MIRIKTNEQIKLMAESGLVTARVLSELKGLIKPGITTQDIDNYVEEQIRKEGMTPTFKGYNGFPAAACISVNDVLVHGIPSGSHALKDGDIVSVDIGATHKGWISDAARTYAVGQISEAAKRLIEVCRQSFFVGLKQCRAGNRLTDISHAIQIYVEENGFSVVLDYVGHGVGRKMHEDPQVRNYGEAGKGPVLMKGMALAIEPMINEGVADVITSKEDGWSVRTRDGKLAAHYENTVIITDGDPMVITLDERDE